MNGFQPLIITASAGTGKTYRLAMEYVRILLEYYEHPDFHIDSILVLTFTRKATSEIKERIIEHLKILAKADDKNRKDLIKEILRGEREELNEREEGIIASVSQELASDRKLLQVMTLDAFINSIFRSLVRPLKNISDFELDLLSVNKRMPFLLEELMTDELRDKLKTILSQRLDYSLDKYQEFFKSLIAGRWLLYLLEQKPLELNPKSLRAQLPDAKAKAEEALGRMLEILMPLLAEIDGIAASKGRLWDEYFPVDIIKLFPRFPFGPQDFCEQLPAILKARNKAMTLYDKVKDLKFYNGNKIQQKKYPHLPLMVEDLRRELSRFLVWTLLVPEQERILEIWQIILKTYDDLLYKYKNFSYDDISWFTFESLFRGDPPTYDLSVENTANEFYEFLSHRSRFILIDEFQDTSLMQFAILKPIIEEVSSGYGAKDFGGLIVVGDEKQSIFGWRGGERDLLLNLEEAFPSLKGRIRKDSLDTSYRSSPTMMAFVNSVFGNAQLHEYLKNNNMAWEYGEVKSAVPKTEALSHLTLRVDAYNSKDKNKEKLCQDWIEAQILDAIRNNDGRSMAILCRTNSQLAMIQSLLDELGESSVYQPNASLAEHRLALPLISFLKWKAFKGWLDWLAWLRSDYVLIKPKLLKQAVDLISSVAECTDNPIPDFGSQPLLKQLYQKSQQIDGSVAEICQQLVDEYLDRSGLSERDQLNLDAFLSLCHQFEIDPSVRDKSIPAWLGWLKELSGQDAIKQVSVEGGDKVQLLTIHKSKGLQFDSVYVYHDLSRGKGSDYGKLDWYAEYGADDFGYLSDYAFSNRYGKLLEHFEDSRLYDSQKQREILEEMNNLYVAFTRAKTQLHILFAYRGEKSWAEFKETQEGKSAELSALLCDACIGWFGDEKAEVRGEKPKPGSEEEPKKASEPEKPLYINQADNLARAISFEPLPLRQAEEEDGYSQRKELWLQNRASLRGNLWHHYLSFIIRNTPAEHEYALRQSIAAFCSLISQKEIQEQVLRLRQKLESHPELFDPKWDKVFTEMPFYQDGKEHRPDRIMIDTKAREVMIVDYKTGSTKEKAQLERYKALLQSLPAVEGEGYRFDTKFVSLE